MKITVIGAGVVGVTSAWYLTQEGHEVTVLEAREGVALETSFGNAGGVCPGFAGPWAAPGMPFKAAKWMFQPSAPLKVRPRASLSQWRWLAQFVANCTAPKFAANKARMQKVAHFSKACLVELREETGIAYDHGTGGVLQVFETPEEYAGGERSAAVLASMGIAHRLLDRDAVLEVEPGLGRSGIRFSGGLQLTTDETGDCHLFCKALAGLAEKAGATFRFNTRVTGLRTAGHRVTAVQIGEEDLPSEAVVIATGPQIGLLKPLGIHVPVYPVKGYSLTAQITDSAAAPRSSVMDEHSKVMITRLGDRLRAAGIAELAGFDPAMPAPVLDGLKTRVAELFPGAADYDTASLWHGFRPMTPDGPSRVERTRYANLYLNLGHGSNGWTQACGTGRMMADLVAGRPLPV
ncbi:D-amino acid dehydrogenase [Pseudooceanicola sp. CBS1P-1]|uniref:FAD-dependent oxidoreductase n=1 Tax=Pseudooceanicola albus TaxID=2692189 RepID=A0A6L7G891_9RHOB|nr:MULTISPECIES: D-amino acid dehydrogenase [Pseudooceanicola]MBT9385943.1 D-amino acid dehydrogenase [Pseudooceanicola endophyticus]MXN19636.1 FAD-dependent oxidoreductase [Pseudooceanicola albus]